MKPVVTRLYSVLVALTFVGLLVWAGADWYQDQQQSQIDGRAALRQAAGLISDLSVRHEPLDGDSLGRSLASLTVEPRWKMVLLSSDQGALFYRGPRPEVPLAQAVPRWEANPLSEVKVAIPVFRASGDPLVLEGILQFYDRPQIFSFLKACGFTLLVLLVVTTLMVIFSPRVTDRSPEPGPEVSASQRPEPEFSYDPEPESEETIGTIPVDDEYWFDDNLTLEDLPPLDPIPPTKAGLGAGSELLPRLEEELLQATREQSDLALVLLADKTGTPLVPWAEAVRQAFPSGQSFGYENGVAVILPGHSLEQALRLSRGLVDDLDARNLGIQVHAGASARAGRSLTATALLAEAASARRRSLAGTVRVLGLKADADRYREGLASASA